MASCFFTHTRRNVIPGMLKVHFRYKRGFDKQYIYINEIKFTYKIV